VIISMPGFRPPLLTKKPRIPGWASNLKAFVASIDFRENNL